MIRVSDKLYFSTTLVALGVLALYGTAQSYPGEVLRASANAIFVFFLTCVSFSFGKLYCWYWRKFFPDSVIRPVFERIVIVVIGMLPIVPIAGLKHFGGTELLLTAVAFFLLTDWRDSILRCMEMIYPLEHASDSRVFFFSYPPTTRLDMLLFDISYVLLAVITVYVVVFE